MGSQSLFGRHQQDRKSGVQGGQASASGINGNVRRGNAAVHPAPDILGGFGAGGGKAGAGGAGSDGMGAIGLSPRGIHGAGI